MAKVNKLLADRTNGVLDPARERAADLYEDVSKSAAGAAKQMGTQARAVSEAARKNPGTTATLLLGVGILSFLLGVAVGLTFRIRVAVGIDTNSSKLGSDNRSSRHL